jgi:hypothetical protein
MAFNLRSWVAAPVIITTGISRVRGSARISVSSSRPLPEDGCGGRS